MLESSSCQESVPIDEDHSLLCGHTSICSSLSSSCNSEYIFGNSKEDDDNLSDSVLQADRTLQVLDVSLEAATHEDAVPTLSTLRGSTLVPCSTSTPAPCHALPSNWVSFKIVGDNIDKNVQPRFMRVDAPTRSLHYFHAYAVKDRVDLSSFSDILT